MDVILIALVIAWLVGMLAGFGAEHAAKAYARQLFGTVRK
jgi:hypothetical protein